MPTGPSESRSAAADEATVRPTPSAVVDLDGLDPQPHVVQAAAAASRLAGDGPVDARAALLAAALVASASKSKAFSYLRDLLSDVALPNLKVPPRRKVGKAQFRFAATEELARAFDRARPAQEGLSFWGRDWVSVALSAAEDPSLDELAREGKTDAETLRVQWQKFAPSGDSRRSPAAWEEWWSSVLQPVDSTAAPESSVEAPAESPASGTSEGPAASDASETSAEPPVSHVSVQEVAFDRAAYLRRVDPEALEVLASAWGLAKETGSERVEIQHLMGGLVQSGTVIHDEVLRELELTPEDVLRVLPSPGADALPPSWPWRELEELPPLAGHVRRALRMAELRAEALRDGRVDVRDVANGALSIPDCSAVQRLQTLGLARGDLPWHWEPPIQLAGYWSDSTAGTDRLNMTREARVLATIMASSHVDPPLSIGLFGAWGSGKSFFMKLLKREILKAQAQESSDICQHIVQIHFNAWHYIDGNLWASLANEVFERLGREIEARNASEEDDDEAERRRKAEATRLLMAARRSRNELELTIERKERAEEELQRVEAELTQLERERWMLQGPIPPERIAREALRALLTTPKRRQELDTALSALGISTEEMDPEALERELRRWEGWKGWIRGWRRTVAGQAAKKGDEPVPGGMGWRHGVAFLAVAAGAVFVLDPRGWIEAILGTLSDAVGIATMVGGMVGPWLKQIARLRESVRPVVDELKRSRRLAHERLKKESERRQERYEERVSQVQTVEREKRSEVADLESRLQELLAGEHIGEFVKERRESEDYRKHLGVIARARQDFQQLSELLGPPRSDNDELLEELLSDAEEMERRRLLRYRKNLPRIDRIVLYIDDLDRCPEDKVVDVLQAVHLLLAFELFVVVVGVDPRWLLHSLADRSDVFQEMDGDGNGGYGRGMRYWRTTPMDYLEKIFQIPFHLRRMDEEGFGELVESLTRNGSEGVEQEKEVEGDAGTEGEPDTRGQQPGVERLDGSDAAEGWQGDGATAGEETEGKGGQDTGLGRAEDRGIDRPSGTVTDRRLGEESARVGGEDRAGQGERDDEVGPLRSPDAAFTPVIPRLTIGSWERRFMKALHPFIDSPRSAKRFVNVYRLVRASKVEPLVGPPTDEHGSSAIDDPHRNVIFLLGMLTGFPGPSMELFRRLDQVPTTDQRWSSFRGSLVAERKQPAGERPFEDDRIGSASSAGSSPAAPQDAGETESIPTDRNVGHDSTGSLSDARSSSAASSTATDNNVDREEWGDFLGALDRAHLELEERNIDFDPSLRALRRWVPAVSRYSFRSGAHTRDAGRR